MPKGSRSKKSASRSKRVSAKPMTQRRRKSPPKTIAVCKPMDVEPPSAIPVNVEEERDKWQGMDVEEPIAEEVEMDVEPSATIVPKKYVQADTDLPEEYRAPEHCRGLVIHGASLNTRFRLPPHIEVVIFSRRGQVLVDSVIAKLLKWINKDFHTISNSSLQEYHLKRILEKNCSERTINAKKRGYMLLQQSDPHYTQSRRFKPYKSYFTATLQIFRGGQECPDIMLGNDKIGKGGIGGQAGFWDLNPLSKDEMNTDVLIHKYPYPSPIDLSQLLEVLFPDPSKRIRLYLFCCRPERKGQEVSNSQASDASKSGNLLIDEHGEVIRARSKSVLRSKGKRSLFSRYKSRW